MLISSHATCFHNSLLSSPFRKLNIRNIYLRSRFQQRSVPTESLKNYLVPTSGLQNSLSSATTSTTSLPAEHVSSSTRANKRITPIASKNAMPKKFGIRVRSRSRILRELQKSIISMLKSTWVDRSLKSSSDLNILTDKTETKPTLSPIDEHILSNAKVMIPSSDHSGNDYQRLKPKHQSNSKLIDDNLYEYKYELINDYNSIVEVDLLIGFVRRLTRFNYLNSTDQIRHFLKSRIIYTDEGQRLLKNNKNLTYCIIDFLMRSGNLSNISTVEDIIKIVGDWDVFSLNIYLKHSLTFCTIPYLRLRLIQSTLKKLFQNNLFPNRTTLYIIYMNTAKAATDSFELKKFKYHLQNLFIERELLNAPEFTSILFDDMYNSLLLVNNERQKEMKKKASSYKKVLITDSVRTMNLIPKFKSLQQLVPHDRFTTKCLRKVFMSAKFKSVESFRALIFAHIESSNWKRAWSMAISNYYVLRDETSETLTEAVKSRLLKEYPELYLTNCGKLFYYDQKYIVSNLQKPIGYKMITHLSAHSNWQLLIRTLNELNALKSPENSDRSDEGVAWNTIYKALRDLLDVDLNKSWIDPMCYLVLLKYLMNGALNTTLGPYKRWDRLFRRAQRKIDYLYKTSYSKLNGSSSISCSEKVGNVFTWLERARLVRAKRRVNSDHQLFESTFDMTECHDVSDEISEVTGNEEIAHSYPYPDTLPTSDLISPDLSVITPFESILFKSISSLVVLDSEEKVEAEHKMFPDFWDSKNINHADVLDNFHLGFIDKSYKGGKIKWERCVTTFYDAVIKTEIPQITEPESETEDLKMKAIAKINYAIEDNLTVLLDKSEDYMAMELVLSAKRPDGVYKEIDPKSSFNNVLPNDWLYMVINKCHNEYLIQQLTKKPHSPT